MVKLQQEHRAYYHLFEMLVFDFAVPATIIPILDHFKWRLISQLIKGISSDLQKLFRYFNGTIISASFVPPFAICSVVFCLNLNEALVLSVGKSIMLPLSSKTGSFYSIAIKFLMSLNKHHYIL